MPLSKNPLKRGKQIAYLKSQNKKPITHITWTEKNKTFHRFEYKGKTRKMNPIPRPVNEFRTITVTAYKKGNNTHVDIIGVKKDFSSKLEARKHGLRLVQLEKEDKIIPNNASVVVLTVRDRHDAKRQVDAVGKYIQPDKVTHYISEGIKQ